MMEHEATASVLMILCLVFVVVQATRSPAPTLKKIFIVRLCGDHLQTFEVHYLETGALLERETQCKPR